MPLQCFKKLKIGDKANKAHLWNATYNQHSFHNTIFYTIYDGRIKDLNKKADNYWIFSPLSFSPPLTESNLIVSILYIPHHSIVVYYVEIYCSLSRFVSNFQFESFCLRCSCSILVRELVCHHCAQVWFLAFLAKNQLL
jgi:hypothetical protein